LSYLHTNSVTGNKGKHRWRGLSDPFADQTALMYGSKVRYSHIVQSPCSTVLESLSSRSSAHLADPLLFELGKLIAIWQCGLTMRQHQHCSRQDVGAQPLTQSFPQLQRSRRMGYILSSSQKG
jgi:hypothetical protein